MTENGNQALRQAELCIESLQRALDHAERANLAWQRVTGNEYATLVDHYHLRTLIEGTRTRAATAAVSQVARRQFPGLPCKPDDWAKQALEADVALVDVATWYAEQVEPTAQQDTWTHMLNSARQMLQRVGEWRERRYEAKQSGSRLTLCLCAWRISFGREWSNNAHDCRDRLLGLEAVIRYADGVDFGLGGTGSLYHAVTSQPAPGTVQTAWVPAPRVTTFKNCRFDLYLRDEALALKIKGILDHVGPTI